MQRFARLAGVAGAAFAVAALGSVSLGGASSHREAPYITTDPQADATDLYAFVSPDAPDTVTFIANYIPFQEAASGPNFYRWGDDVLYEINIDNDGDAIEDISFQFDFRSDINPANAFGPNTFLANTGPVASLDDPDLNLRQFYSVSMMTGEGGAARGGTVIAGASNLQVIPYDAGPTSYPDYNAVAAQGIYTLGNGVKVFVGPRDDSFFIDVGGVFDLLNLGTPDDQLSDNNVQSIVIQVPIAMLSASGAMPTGMSDPNAIIGVRTTSYRQGVRVLRNLGDTGSTLGQHGTGALESLPSVNRGPWVQLSRLDLPLINEVIIPLKDKDRWNGSKPKNDGQFLPYVNGTAPGSTATAAPHYGALLEIVFGAAGVDVPAAPRTDLVNALLLGISGVNLRTGETPSSQLRLNMMIKPDNTTADNRLGVVGGDLQGFPNGRRLADDVLDIETVVVAGFLVDSTIDPPLAGGDGVNANDVPFLSTFPYIAPPKDYVDVEPGG